MSRELAPSFVSLFVRSAVVLWSTENTFGVPNINSSAFKSELKNVSSYMGRTQFIARLSHYSQRHLLTTNHSWKVVRDRMESKKKALEKELPGW